MPRRFLSGGRPRGHAGKCGLALAGAALVLSSGCRSQDDISFFVLVKSSNYAQSASGQLTLLNHHFFSEIFPQEGGRVERAALRPADGSHESMAYEDRAANYYVEGGHFETLAELDAAYPNGDFLFDVQAPSVSFTQEPLRLAGPGGETLLPEPITITLLQAGESISPVEIDPTEPLTVRWSEYSVGAADPRGIVDDMIFVVFADCNGERVFHTGLPFEGEYLTFFADEATVPAHTLLPGRPYSMFVEFPHVVDSRVIDGVPGFTSYATATYLDLRTTGEAADSECPEVAPPMDTGQTDRMEPEPGDSTANGRVMR
jgi:hypothetical protein